LNLIKERNGAAHLQVPDLEITREGTRSLSLEEVWKLVTALGDLKPPQSPRRFAGPALNWVRRWLWRLVGFEATHGQLVSLVCKILEPHLIFREGTFDRDIWEGVINYNEYRLPEVFAAHDIILDIGMHIGSFCYAALTRGCRNVYGFEADRENFLIAVQNLKMFGDRVHPYHKAVWRSDRTGDALFFAGYGSNNTGGGTILYNTTGEKLDVIAFDEIIREVTNEGQKRIRMVKIDCEGSEYPILLTSRLLHLIDSIHGEYHNCPIPTVARIDGVERFSIAELTQHLEKAGFQVESFAKPDNIGMFFATRS
jgi:FkbM family methyltransferase